MNSSHGTIAANRTSPARSTSQAPRPPPIRLMSIRFRSGTSVDWISRRSVSTLATLPGTTAMALVALAATGDTPTASSAENVKKVPPPAIEFILPATKPASASSAPSVNDIFHPVFLRQYF